MTTNSNKPHPLTLLITPHRPNTLINLSQSSVASNNKLRVEIAQPCRIFKHYQSGNYKIVGLRDAAMGKIPGRGYVMVFGVDLVEEGGVGSKYGGICVGWRINKPCEYHTQSEDRKYQLPYNQVYLSLRNYTDYGNQKGYRLACGDVIRFGGSKFRILAIGGCKNRQNNSYDNQHTYQSQKNSTSIHHQNTSLTLEGHCKICLHGNQPHQTQIHTNSQTNNQTDPQDFMITPCQCKGSCANVHYRCLKEWMQGKVRREVRAYGIGMGYRYGQGLDRVVTYNFEKFLCEICKGRLPGGIVKEYEVELGGFTNIYAYNRQQPLYLFDPNLPPSPYLILQPIPTTPTTGPHPQKWHILTFQSPNPQPIYFGRSTTTNLPLFDSHISRIHAQISYSSQDDAFYLKDLHSEYGSFVRVGQEMVLGERVRRYGRGAGRSGGRGVEFVVGDCLYQFWG